MKIQWFGHACFRVEADGYAIILDPYADGAVPGLPPLRAEANEALCSHGHSDHNAVDVITLSASAPSPFTVTTIESFHDEQDGSLRGPNTIHVLAANGLRVAHLGDQGVALTDAQIAQIGRLDALMIPIGGHYTIDAETAHAVAATLRPRVIIPMHYRGDGFGYDVIGTLEPFLRLYGQVNRVDGSTIEITGSMPEQVAVPTYP